MDIHPLIVHFPVALLTLYAIFEIGSFGRLKENATWKTVKAVLLVCGFFSALLAFQTGQMAERIFGGGDVVRKHEFFATLSIWIFAFPTFAYLFFFREKAPYFQSLQTKVMEMKVFSKIYSLLQIFADFLLKRSILFLLALCGLATLTVTGALGGSLVHGTDVDPVVKFIYDLVM